MELTEAQRTRMAAILEDAGSHYSILSALYYGAADSARSTYNPAVLAELEEMIAKFKVDA